MKVKIKYKQSYDGELKIYEKETFSLIKDKDNKKEKISGYNIKVVIINGRRTLILDEE